jgi:ArsR family transcriptional regulator
MVSRHLTVLRSAGILTRQRKGAEVFYEITSPKIVEVCEMMREILAEQESHHVEILNILQE